MNANWCQYFCLTSETQQSAAVKSYQFKS